MQGLKMRTTTVVLLLSLFSPGCATTNAQNHWLSDPDDVPTNVWGGWISIQCGSEPFAGELIAICNDSAFVADKSLHAIPLPNIITARLVIFDASGAMGVGVAIGTLSTISNGYYLILTAPMWLICGTIAASSRSYDPILDYPKASFQEFVPFARFPQGLPVGLSRNDIRMKTRSEYD